jgi:hypothetical protein
VALRRGEMELTVERPLGAEPGAGVVRLSARFDPKPDGAPPDSRELAEALERLRAELDSLVGPVLAAAPVARPDRSLSELVDTYRPRQRELVDILRDEGELTSTEHTQLREYLATQSTAPPPPAPRPSLADQPIAAIPIAADHTPESARPVPELLRTYQIESLRQAGAVRARRQISFDEYMALKRHFESNGERSPNRGSPAAPP